MGETTRRISNSPLIYIVLFYRQLLHYETVQEEKKDKQDFFSLLNFINFMSIVGRKYH